MKFYLFLISTALLLGACSDGPKVLTNEDEKPEVREPSESTDGYIPYTPENAIALLRPLLERESAVDMLLSFSGYASAKFQYTGNKDISNAAILSTEKEGFKKFIAEEFDRMEKEYPQKTRFVFKSASSASGVLSVVDQAVKFNFEEHHDDRHTLIAFRMHENLKWKLHGKEDAEKERAVELLKAYSDNRLPVQCYGEYAFSSGYDAKFDLTRCDVFAPSGEIIVSTVEM